jgi:hypothetical protein
MPFSVVEHLGMGGMRTLVLQAGGIAALAAAAVWLQSTTLERTHSPNCDEPTATDLRCAIERDWRLQVRARTDGPGVVYAAGCRLGPPSRWGELENFEQAHYRLLDIDVSIEPGGGATTRTALGGPGGDSLSFRDTWTWSSQGWSNTRCGWIMGRPMTWEWLYEEALRSPQIRLSYENLDGAIERIEVAHVRTSWLVGRGW